MSGGILSNFIGGAIGGDQAQMGNGILGNLNGYMTNNAGTLLGFGAGMLAGDNSMAAQGALQGIQADQRTRLLKQAEADKERQRVAAQNLAQQIGKPELAEFPDLAASLYLTQNKPKDLSFEERQFNKLTPEQQAAYRQREFLGGGDNNELAKIQQRHQAAGALGLREDDPRYQSYVLTGKMPREDAQPLSATDKKAILEADEGVAAAANAIDALERAKQLSSRAYEGFTAGPRSSVTSMWGDEAGVATQELDNLVGTNALAQMKSIFGANPTEGERAIMMELQGASNKPHEVRVKIYERAQEMARRRLEFNRQRANAMRGGDFYKAGLGQQQSQPNTQQATQGKTSSGVTWSVD